MTPHAQTAMLDSKRYPLNLYLINNVEQIVVFLVLKVFDSDISYMFSCSRSAQVTFVKIQQV